ncbi:hypothetical protein [Streptomyces sp. NPDC007905]|uniref:hypothetical protein n=1 Tax=Streptomyces sp. NPDC007905 TaxID=3364788 RepID=UPI0036E48E73
MGTVTGFLCGRSATSVEAAETGRALADGAAEFDMVIDVGRLRAGDDAYVAADIEAASRPLGEDSSKSSWRTPV